MHAKVSKVQSSLFQCVFFVCFRKTVNKNAWTEEEENELRTLFEEHKESEGQHMEIKTIEFNPMLRIHNSKSMK